MRAVILAAGLGLRLRPYTANRPKCLLPFAGRSLLQHQIAALRSCGIDRISIVKGYLADTIVEPGIFSYFNPLYSQTNLVASLFCAEPELTGDVIVAYGDVIYERRIIEELIGAHCADVTIPVDQDWNAYYRARFGGHVSSAKETLTIAEDGRLLEIGNPTSTLDNIHGTYIGLTRLSSNGCRLLRELYYEVAGKFGDGPWMRGRALKQGLMRDLLQALIDRGAHVNTIKIRRGWVEFNSVDDYEKALQWHDEGSLHRFISLSS